MHVLSIQNSLLDSMNMNQLKRQPDDIMYDNDNNNRKKIRGKTNE